MRIHDLEVLGLLDSGSAVTIIGNNAHRVLLPYNSTLHSDQCISLTAAGGQTLSSLGYIHLPVTFANEFHIIKAHVVPDVNTDLILGIDFWRQFKILPKH